MKYFLLGLSLLATNVYAEQIITSNGAFNTSESGSGLVCQKMLFLKQTTGTLVTGLTTASVKLYAATHVMTGSNAAIYGHPTENVTVNYNLSPVYGTPGLYNLCVTPVSFEWAVSDTYEFRFAINKVTDNGGFILKFQN